MCYLGIFHHVFLEITMKTLFENALGHMGFGGAFYNDSRTGISVLLIAERKTSTLRPGNQAAMQLESTAYTEGRVKELTRR